jgi:hypothetical protein
VAASSGKNLTLANVNVPNVTSVQPDIFTEQDQRDYATAQEAKAAELSASTSFGDVASEAINQNQILPMLLRQAGREDMADDPGFTFTPELFKEHIQKDIPEQFWDEFTPSDVRSMGQLQERKAEIQAFMARQDTLMAKGVVTGVGASVLASVLDPAAIGVSVATEGVLAPLVFTNKVTRLSRAVRGGFLTAAGVAPVEGYIAYNDPTYDASDAVMSTLAAAGIGAAFAARTRPYDQALRDMHQAALADEAASAGAKVTPAGRPEYGKFVLDDGTPMSAEQVNRPFFERNKGWDTFGTALRLDRAATNMSSDSAKVRGLSSVLFEDPAAVAGTLKGETATLWKQREQGRVMRTFLKSRKANLNAYMQEQGLGWSQSLRASREFNLEVTRALRGQEVVSEAVKKHAAETRKLYDDISRQLSNTAREGKEGAVAVKGHESATLEDYVSRRWSGAAMEAAIMKMGSRQAVQEMIAGAVRGMTKENAMKVADHLMQVTMRSRQGGLSIGNISQQGENLERFLRREHGFDEAESKRIADSLRRLTGGDDAGRAGSLKHRLDVDEAQVEDLLENDIDTLFSGYANTMLGHVALARQGIDSEATFQRLLQEANEELASKPLKGKRDQWARKAQIRNLEDAYDHLVGRPVGEDPNTMGSTAGRLVRKVNYSRLMNMVGLAQIAEFGVMASHVGLKAMLHNMPELAKIRRKLKSGDFKDGLIEELSDLMGGWADFRLMHRSATRIEEFGAAEGQLSKTERFLDGMNAATTDISGFNYVNQVLHSYAMKSMAQTFLDAARTGKKHVLSTNRLRELGIDDELMGRIKAEYMKKGGAQWSDAGKLKRLNLQNWDDEVRVKFGNAMRRWGNTVVQENDFGEMPAFMSSTIGKLLFQFKSFMFGSHVKQVVNNINHRDRTSAAMLFNTTFGGALSYFAYVGTSSVGRQDQQEYLDRMLTLDRIAAGAFQRSSISSFIPGIIDGPAALGIYPAQFDTRASGLQSNLITGSASYDLVNKLATFGQEAVEAVKDDEITSNTARSFFSLLPFQNALGIRNALNVLYDELPEDSNF